MSLHPTKTNGLRHNLFIKMVMFFCVAISLLMLLLSAQFVSAAESGASAPIVLNVDPVLAMTTNTDNLALSVLPTLDGTLSTGEVTVNLSTNNYTGYTLSMSTTTDNTALMHSNGSNSISSTTGSVSTPTTLSRNTWGWYPSSLATNPGGSSNYQFAAVPGLSSAYTVKSTDTMVRVGRLELPASCSQKYVRPFKEYFCTLFNASQCSGNSSLELFCPACFKKTFRLLGFMWDWILCIKRCSVRFEGGTG